MLPITVDASTAYATKRGHLGFANNGVSGAATFTVAATTNIGLPKTSATADQTRVDTVLVASSAAGRLAPVTAVTGRNIDLAR